jgi:hypothetical protein
MIISEVIYVIKHDAGDHISDQNTNNSSLARSPGLSSRRSASLEKTPKTNSVDLQIMFEKTYLINRQKNIPKNNVNKENFNGTKDNFNNKISKEHF